MATTDVPPPREPRAALEQAFIEDYLQRIGHTRESLRRLPPSQQAILMRTAASFATMKLSEIEARAHFVHELTAE